jgi:uncharacterized paraquat-inducible protein A
VAERTAIFNAASDYSGAVALQVVLALSIVVPLAILGVVCWLFWKARGDE